MAANQGSRAGLITSVVILAIVSVAAIIFAFWFSAQKNKTDTELSELRRRYQGVVSETGLASPEIKDLQDLTKDKDSGFNSSMKAIDVAMEQRNQLVKLVTGKDADNANNQSSALKLSAGTLAAASEAIKNANARIPSTSDNLLGAITLLADKVKTQAQTIADRDAKITDAEKRALDAVTQKTTELGEKDKQIEKIRAEADAAMEGVKNDRKQQASTVSDIEKDRDTERKAHQDAIAKKDVDIAAKAAEIKKLEDRLKVTQARFDKLRVGVTSPILRHGDGNIVSLSTTNKEIVYINLGRGQQIIPGLTFEVYDKNRGIPKLGDALGDEQPAGKASIEVTRIMDDSCECRVITQQIGQQISVGDIILNVVYDPTIKYNFVVFGRFDLDRNGVSTLQDADIVRRLITQWGAKVSDQITVETDFLIIGTEPVVPTFTQEELADPVNAKKLTDAQKDMDDYLNILQKAKELHIPVLNQNRFLYFTGQSSVIAK